jgi:hypothetical protein
MVPDTFFFSIVPDVCIELSQGQPGSLRFSYLASSLEKSEHPAPTSDPKRVVSKLYPMVNVYLPNGFVSMPLALSSRPCASVFT